MAEVVVVNRLNLIMFIPPHPSPRFLFVPIPGRGSSEEGGANLKIIPHSYLDSRGSAGSSVQVYPPLLIWTTRLRFPLTSNLPLYRRSAEACSPGGPRLSFHRDVIALALFQRRLKNAESAFIRKRERERENVREVQVRKAVNSTLFMSGGPMGSHQNPEKC